MLMTRNYSNPCKTGSHGTLKAVPIVMSMLKHATFPAAVMDSDLNIVTWNSAFCHATRTDLSFERSSVPEVNECFDSHAPEAYKWFDSVLNIVNLLFGPFD